MVLPKVLIDDVVDAYLDQDQYSPLVSIIGFYELYSSTLLEIALDAKRANPGAGFSHGFSSGFGGS